MGPLQGLAVGAAGLVAGTVNTIVGSGSLVTFPVLLACGYSPLVANVSNTVGLVPGSVSGAIGYRRELAGQRGRVLRWAIAAAVGGLVGGVLLLAAPDTFEAVVPGLVIAAALLMAASPRLSARARARAGAAVGPAGRAALGVRREPRLPVALAVGLTGVYGGYFGAAQGVILLALLALLVEEDLQRLNAAKNVLASAINAVAAVLFILVSDVDWAVAAVLAVGSTVGGQLGAAAGRRIPARVLRAVVVVGGLGVGIVLLLRR